METLEDSKADIPLRDEFPFVDVNAIKQEPNFDEEQDINAELTDGWLTVDVKKEHIGTNDIKEEPSEISTCKIEVTCSKTRKIPDRRTHKCLFCDAYVYNFATHLERKHSDIEQVKEILALDKTDFNRKRMIGRLRKEGNFYAGDVVPVQIKKTQMLEANSCGLMPCTHCKGYYARRSLRRHVQRCSFNKTANSTVRKHQCDGHTLMSRHFDPNDVLRTSGVLRSLKPDEISLVAKKDAVICEVAREYVKHTSGKAFLSMVNRHMRVLARLLIAARRIENDDTLSLLSVLHPSKFKTIVKATQIICGYDPVKRSFNVPSLAAHMETLLRRALGAANSMKAQDDAHSFSLDMLNATRRLFNENWTKELSMETFDSDLDEIGLIKARVISITEDLVKLKTYTDNLILKAKLELQFDTKDQVAYRTLIEGTYCRTFLFNDQPMSEIEQILLELYCNYENDRVVEIPEELLLIKKILIQNVKYFEITGNNDKNGLILIDKLTQEAIDLALEYRQNFYQTNNQYLFGLPGSDICIDGYDTFKKHYTIALGDRNNKLSLFTSKRFREHLATISQIVQMNSDELNQLQISMGYTIKGHAEYNNQALDVDKIAKISKMVLFCGNNCPTLYKGCDLDDVDLGNDLIEADDYDDNEDDSEKEQTERYEGSSENERNSLIEIRKRKKAIRRMWTHDEKMIADGHFNKHIKEKLVPKKKEVLQFMEIYKQLFKHRRWETIKAYVYCHYNLEEGIFCLLSSRSATTCKDLTKTIPKNFFHIKQNISVLRCIPENIIFGPYSGLESLRNNTSFVWILNGGKQAEIENKHLYNWMRFIPFSREKSECNLNVFQFNRLLYFRAIRSIACGEELLAYLDEHMVKDFSNDTGKYYYPVEEVVQRVYACIPCCLGFKSEEYLRKHLENYIHNNKPPTDIIQCPLCKIVSFDRKHLKYHLTNNCVINKSKSQKSYDYNSGELHKCMICDLVYKHKSNLNRHMNSHNIDKQFTCYQCDFKTSRKGYLESHIIAKHIKEYACGQCDFVTKRKRELKSHKIIVHSTSIEGSKDADEIETKPNLEVQSTSKNAPKTETKRFRCSICNQSLTERATLARHVRVVHAGERPYQCEYCDYKCASSASLHKHIKIHTGERPHKCQICYRTFLEKHKLKRHMIVHLRQGYPCCKCRHRAPTVDALDAHVQQKHKFGN